MTNDTHPPHGCAQLAQPERDIRRVLCDCGTWYESMTAFSAHLSEQRWGRYQPTKRDRRYPKLGGAL